ncbi:MAG: 5-(carboxyamino)imidazole ribonucleotide synthase [Ignavibacteria bacterium]
MKIGILGGGQLARMIIEECYKYGFEFHVLSKDPDSPAGQVTKYETAGEWDDENCLRKFSEGCDIITLENEFIDPQKIRSLEDRGKKVFPGSKVIGLIQDKLYQKKTLEKINIPVAKFCEVNDQKDILNFAKQHGYPVVLKSRTMGYDGKGNYLINSEKDVETAFESLSSRGELMCESFVNFDKEIATQVTRSISGEIKVYPVVETIQKDHICNFVIASKDQFEKIKLKAEEIAKKVVTELDYAGTLGIEMFLTGSDILVNELAPRVHNSGHYTIEGCYTSQFENHIRAIMNFPLGSTQLRENNSVMINIIGERNGLSKLQNAGELLSKEKVYLHVYGKKETRFGRKMGHITVLGDDLSKTIALAKECREAIRI